MVWVRAASLAFRFDDALCYCSRSPKGEWMVRSSPAFVTETGEVHFVTRLGDLIPRDTKKPRDEWARFAFARSRVRAFANGAADNSSENDGRTHIVLASRPCPHLLAHAP